VYLELGIINFVLVKESGLILLQTIPNDINIDLLRKELLEEFPDVVNIHDLHVWQFTPDKVFATSHIVFTNPKVRSEFNYEVYSPDQPKWKILET